MIYIIYHQHVVNGFFNELRNTRSYGYNFWWFMVLNATLNNISVISWWSVLLVEENEVPRESHQPVTDKLYHIMYRVHLA